MEYNEATKMMSPARQYIETAKLRDAAKATQLSQDKLSASTRDNLRKAAETILADKLKVRIEGNWALTSGSSVVYENGNPLPFALEDLVWICVDGDWWNYDMTPVELATYGNPPDFARNALLVKKNLPTIRDFTGASEDLPVPAVPSSKPEAAGADAGSVKPATDTGKADQEGGHGS